MTTSRSRVLLVGWDAADWKVIRPLLDQGQMPNLARLVAGGVSGNLATLYPTLSPMLWTSIATGKRPGKHGIHGFIEPLPGGGGVRPARHAAGTVRRDAPPEQRVIHWLEARPGIAVLPLEYDAILRNPQGAAEAVAAFLGGDGFDVQAAALAVDPALKRQGGG